jgi:hypothetical protein
VTVIRSRARLGFCGLLVWRRARPARPLAPGQQQIHRGKRRASLAVRWVRLGPARSAGRVFRWGWSGALWPAPAGGRLGRRPGPVMRPGRDAGAPRLGVRWLAVGRPCRLGRGWLGRGRRWSGRRGSRCQRGPEGECAGAFGHGGLRSINCCCAGDGLAARWRRLASGPAATSHGLPSTDAVDWPGEWHAPAAHGWPGCVGR